MSQTSHRIPINIFYDNAKLELSYPMFYNAFKFYFSFMKIYFSFMTTFKPENSYTFIVNFIFGDNTILL